MAVRRFVDGEGPSPGHCGVTDPGCFAGRPGARCGETESDNATFSGDQSNSGRQTIGAETHAGRETVSAETHSGASAGHTSGNSVGLRWCEKEYFISKVPSTEKADAWCRGEVNPAFQGHLHIGFPITPKAFANSSPGQGQGESGF